MENMAAGDPIGKEAECEDFVINIPPYLPPAKWDECCIYRIPKKLYEVNKKAYIPKLVSIGPFHHRREDLRNMKMQKLRYLRDFFEHRTSKSQKDLLKIIKDNEVKIRRCYSETFEHSSKEFVNMILLDAIFIIELFLRTAHPKEGEKDYILSTPWLRIGIQNDLILLENQLPFFVLEQLYMFALCVKDKNDPKKQDAPFVRLSRDYFSNYDQQAEESIISKEVEHFTDLLRYLFCSIQDWNQKSRERLDNVYSATKLDDSGLKFKAAKEKRLLEIKFSKNKWLGHFPCFNSSWLLACLPCLLGSFLRLERMQSILEIPPLEIYDNTEAVFRNLMALEQCHYPNDTCICDYVMLIDFLIDTEKDVDLLVDKKVIVNNIGSNAAVASLINKLCLEIVVDGFYYSALGKEINKYCDRPLNRIMATMKSVYFRDFWRGTATVVALIFLLYQFWGFLRPFIRQLHYPPPPPPPPKGKNQ